jgi:hypothetical protein
MTVPFPTAVVPFGLPLSRRKHGFKTKGRSKRGGAASSSSSKEMWTSATEVGVATAGGWRTTTSLRKWMSRVEEL